MVVHAPAKPAVSNTATEIIVYQHSPMFYWWPVWVYGYFCAFWTSLYGHPFEIGGHKAVMVHSGAWLGLSFLVVLMAILWVSHMKVRGAHSLVVFLLVLMGAGALQALGMWSPMFAQLKLLLVFMNQAFYVVIASGFLLMWFLSVVLADRMQSWTFKAGQVIEHHVLSDEDKIYPTKGMEVKRQPNDFLVHKILGLAFLGGGTGDLELVKLTLTPTGAVRERIQLENVWRARKRKRQIESLLAGS